MNRFARPTGILAGLLLTFAVAAQAPAPATSEREIEQLITALGSSGCQFQRNGSWYPASEAQSHLRRKYDYLRKRDLVASAEQFIERAGTQSSMSGKAYQVRCPGQPAVASSTWLTTRLAAIRHAPP
ncbi:MAG TPA: DUF5329 domain-containing protein [Lysobacter sp.]